MSKLSSIIHSFGTDEETLRCLKWLTKQNLGDVHNFLDSIQDESFDSTIASLYAKTQDLTNVPPMVVESLLNEHGKKNPVRLAENLELKFSNFDFEPIRDRDGIIDSYSCHFTADAYMDGEIVCSYPVNDQIFGSAMKSAKTIFRDISRYNLRSCCTFTFEKTNDILQTALDIERAERELKIIQRMYTASGQKLEHTYAAKIAKFISWSMRTYHSTLPAQLKSLMILYNQVVDRSFDILIGRDFACIRGMQVGEPTWSFYIEDSQGAYNIVDKNHLRFPDISDWAERERKR